MKLSIVIPARNEEDHIGPCLESLFKAIGDRDDIEVIVVDNGSTDGTDKVVANYPKAKLVKEPTPGTSRAREAGFRASSSPLVGFIDADTMMPAHWIPTAEKEFQRHPKLVCLSGPYLYYDLPRGINFLVKIYYLLAYGVYVLSRFVFRTASVVIGGNYVVRREALEAIGGHNVTITFYGDDTDIARRMSKVGQVKFSFGFPIYSSGRRFIAEGLMTTAVHYVLNYFWIVLFGEPFTSTAKPAQTKQARETKAQHAATARRDWFATVSALLLMLAAIGVLIYSIYYLVETGVISTITLIQIETKAKNESQEFETKLHSLATSTKNMIEEINESN